MVALRKKNINIKIIIVQNILQIISSYQKFDPWIFLRFNNFSYFYERFLLKRWLKKQIEKNFAQSHAPVPAPAPAPPERPPESELNGAIFEIRAFDKPAEAPEKNVVALLMMGPMLPVAAWIFWDTRWLRNSDVAECLLSMPKAAFFALLDSSRTTSAFVFESKKVSTFYKDIRLLKELIVMIIIVIYIYIMYFYYIINF